MLIDGDHAAARESLAVNGGDKAVEAFEGAETAKIGVEEFMALAELWGFRPPALDRIRDAVAGEDLGGGPWLGRYCQPGPSRVDAFERLARELFGVPFALGVHSGTSALETAYVGCGIGPGDEVIIPGYTFFATATAVVAAGAVPVIAEVDESLTLDPADIEHRITPRTKAIVPVHMIGVQADMPAIMEVAERHGLVVVEDAAQACGAKLNGRRLGTYGTAGCFSVSSYKAVGAGEAGLVLTSSEQVYMRAVNHHDTSANWRPDRYAPERFAGELFCGTNLRMSELEGTVNTVQLTKMDALLARLRANKARIQEALPECAGITPQVVHDPSGELANHLVFFTPSPVDSRLIADALAAEGVPAWSYGLGTGTRDWHVYRYWEQILEKKTASPSGFPWSGAGGQGPSPVEYHPDMCPRTLDLVGRAVLVDVVDWWTEGDCRRVGEAISKVLRAYYPAAGRG